MNDNGEKNQFTLKINVNFIVKKFKIVVNHFYNQFLILKLIIFKYNNESIFNISSILIKYKD